MTEKSAAISDPQTAPESKKTVIRIENLFLSFGGVKALTDISIDIKAGEILAIIGPNGAGKTCVLNCINGFYKPQKGSIYISTTSASPASGLTGPPKWDWPAPFRISSSIAV